MTTPVEKALKEAKEQLAKKLSSTGGKIVVHISGNLEYSSNTPNVVFKKDQ